MSPLDERGYMIEFVFFGIMLLPAVMMALTPVGVATKRNGRQETKKDP